MAEEQSYYDKLLENSKASISASMPSSAATDDQMYARYLERYKTMGQSQMKDTMGQAATGLTNGYSSTYGQSKGQQAYNDYVQQANDQMLDYAQQARSLMLQQNEYANNLASAQYDRDLAQAQLGATYGDFSTFGNMFGSTYADAWKAMWQKMNPGL